MYQEIGKVSAATVLQLKSIINDVKWEYHASDVTNHHAASCREQVLAVDELTWLWPIATWDKLTLLRLPSDRGKLYRHADQGFGFHIPVETNKNAISMTYPDGISKAQHLEVGKIYEVDRSIEHESYNTGKTDRTHLIVILK